jgi:hypothetical protein
VVAGKVSREHLAGRGGLTGGEVEELKDPVAVDGVIDCLPGLDAGERWLAGVEENIVSAQLEAEVDMSRVPDGEGLVVLVEYGEIGPAGDNR